MKRLSPREYASYLFSFVTREPNFTEEEWTTFALGAYRFAFYDVVGYVPTSVSDYDFSDVTAFLTTKTPYIKMMRNMMFDRIAGHERALALRLAQPREEGKVESLTYADYMFALTVLRALKRLLSEESRLEGSLSTVYAFILSSVITSSSVLEVDPADYTAATVALICDVVHDRSAFIRALDVSALDGAILRILDRAHSFDPKRLQLLASELKEI